MMSSNLLQLSKIRRINRSVSNSFSLRISATCDDRSHAPSCIYVGPLQTATKETLEALYSQARDAYYSGEPLIVDDMFDRVELKLKWFGSKSVVKYPRCSIRRQSAYADAEEDLSMILALASTWTTFLAFGSLACLGPISYTVGMAYQNSFNSGLSYGSQTSAFGFLVTVNSIMFIVLGFVIGYPVASASVKVLQGLWRNDLVALKGACPNCGEEVFAFVRMDRNIDSPHRTDCHVCESLLEFRTNVECILMMCKLENICFSHVFLLLPKQNKTLFPPKHDPALCMTCCVINFQQSVSRFGRQWVYGRIYLVSLRGKSRRQRQP